LLHGSEPTVLFRGTSSYGELIENDFGNTYLAAHASPGIQALIRLGVPLPYPPQEMMTDKSGSRRFGGVNAAFLATFRSVIEGVEKGMPLVFPKDSDNAMLTLAGHSLGAGVACLAAAWFANSRSVRLLGVATPKPGSPEFVSNLEQMNVGTYLYANDADIVPVSPTSVVPNFAEAKGILKYANPLNVFRFAGFAESLVQAHTIMTYVRAIEKAIES